MSPDDYATATSELVRLATFAQRVQVWCTVLGGSVTSWVRTAAHNAAVGGVPTSYHVGGLGADVVYDAPIELERAELLATLLQLKLVRETDHDHLQALTR